jgi:hypothetical protein
MDDIVKTLLRDVDCDVALHINNPLTAQAVFYDLPALGLTQVHEARPLGWRLASRCGIFQRGDGLIELRQLHKPIERPEVESQQPPELYNRQFNSAEAGR